MQQGQCAVTLLTSGSPNSPNSRRGANSPAAERRGGEKIPQVSGSPKQLVRLDFRPECVCPPLPGSGFQFGTRTHTSYPHPLAFSPHTRERLVPPASCLSSLGGTQGSSRADCSGWKQEGGICSHSRQHHHHHPRSETLLLLQNA